MRDVYFAAHYGATAGELEASADALQENDLATYRKLAQREDPFGIRKVRNLRSGPSHL